jgi:hypothetical protein
MSEAPSAGWREVYRWCHVETPDHREGEVGEDRGT